MRKHAVAQGTNLLGKLAFRVNRVAKSPAPQAVEQMRAAMRRFSYCLRILEDFFPPGRARKVRKQLRVAGRLAAEVRHHDVALELARRAGLQPESALCERLQEERRRAAEDLALSIERWRQRDFSRRWRKRLRL